VAKNYSHPIKISKNLPKIEKKNTASLPEGSAFLLKLYLSLSLQEQVSGKG
jgi:hypothetical protein